MILDAQRAKIVVGDSDRAVLELLQIRLDLAGYHACVARDGYAVLELLKCVRPAALIVDKALTGLDGFGVLQTLSQRGGASYPVLLMGKNVDATDIKRALSLGVRDCMAKPFSGADMLERVARLLRAPPRPVFDTIEI